MPDLTLLFLIGVILILGLLRILHLFGNPEKPSLFYNVNSDFVSCIINSCPILSEIYHPPFLWGHSGHLHTLVYGLLGRVNSPFLKGERICHTLSDGATMTFDIFEPLEEHKQKGDFTLLICPGIANSCESHYIRTFVDYAQRNGYRCAVLNHLGALQSVRLTSPRIFSYGGTDEFNHMLQYVCQRYPKTVKITIGFSMGGNIVTKFLGENKQNQEKILCGMSICQGYDALKAQPLLGNWAHLRRAYLWVMTENMKNLLQRHSDILFCDEVKQRFPGLNEQKIFSCTSIIDLDEMYSRRIHGFNSVEDYYRWCSCIHVMNNIEIPMLILNSNDDPLVPVQLLNAPKEFVNKHDKSIFVLTKHGGHLGFFEGRLLSPKPITWLDRLIIQYVEAVIKHHAEAKNVS